MTDYKQLCAELVNELHAYKIGNPSHDTDLIDRARVALAEPAQEGPTLDDIWELCEEHEFTLDVDGTSEEENCNVLWAIAHAVLTRWGRPAPEPPADGEVAELVEWLLEEADDYDCIGETLAPPKCRRAAELLSQRYPQPVPVSERLPESEDCDAEGRCWWGRTESDDWWTFATHESIAEFCEFTPRTVWLPANSLPLPQLS